MNVNIINPNAFSTIGVTGISTFTGAKVTTANAMGALAIDVTKALNTKTISADSTFTFSGTPGASNQWFAMLVENSDSSSHVLTIPSSFSVARVGTITSVTIPASGKMLLTWCYDGSVYNLYGDPPATIGSGSFVLSSSITRSIGFGKDGGGSALSTSTISAARIVPFAATITGWSISVDTGTATVKFWKIATGTAIPTISNVINTSGVAISTGTNVRSSTVSDFTTTAIATGDIIMCAITAVSGATWITIGLEFSPS